MKFKILLMIVVSTFLLSGREIFASSGVIINEIAWMGTLDSANNEWIELYNNSSSSVSIEGWRILAGDGTPDITLKGAVGAGGYFLLERTNDDTVPGVSADQIYSGALENSGEILILKNSAGAQVDRVDGSNNWAIGGNNTTKETLQRTASGWITATSTPRAPNYGYVTASGSLANQNVVTSTVSYSAPAHSAYTASSPTIKAYAGEDRRAMAGELVDFSGSAAGFTGEPLINARFLWNLGNGELREGRAIQYSFPLPGDYTVGLHVSSGSETASDYLTVTVLSNQIAVNGVIEGDKGFISLFNEGAKNINIGGWILEDGSGRTFTIPDNTIVASKSEISFANSIAGLLKNAAKGPVLLRYPNTVLAFSYTPSEINSDRKTSSVSSPAGLFASSPQEILAEKNTWRAKATSTLSESPPESANVFAAGKENEGNTRFLLAALALSVSASAGFFIIKRFLF